MKKAFTVIFTILIMCCLFTVVSMATEIGGVDYNLTESADGNTAKVTISNKTVTTKNVVIPKTVEYEGKTYTVTSIQGRAFEKNKNIETLVIEADFAENGYGTYVFNECSNLKTVTLPDTMKKIPDRWFRMCTSLESINFPFGITAIEDCAFWRCTSLKSIDLPSTITSVGEKAFEDCTSVTTINCASQVLGNRMFYNCKAVQSMTLTGTVTIKSDALYYCGIKNSGNTLIIPQTVTTIEENAFRYCFFDTVVIPKGLTNVSTNAFANMKNYSDLIKYTGTDEEAQVYFANVGIPYELVNHCETYNNGNHTYDNETCIANCTECGIDKIPTLSDHTLTLEYAYENGFVSSGKKITKCTVEGCKYSVSEEIQAIISLIGYSSKIGGDNICVSYSINQKAYTEYKNAGYTLSFGVVAYVPSEGETDLEPVNNDLSGKTTNTVVASIDSEYVGFDFVINGFNEEHHGLSLVMCAYVYDGETVSYVSTSGENSVQTKYARTITYYYE